MGSRHQAKWVLDRAERPGEALDLSYGKRVDNLQRVRRDIADVLTSKDRLDAQRDTLEQQFDTLQSHARAALQQGQEELARAALTHARLAKRRIDGLDREIEQLGRDERQLELVGEKVLATVEAVLLRMAREPRRAQHSAATANTQTREGVTHLSEQTAPEVLERLRRARLKLQLILAGIGVLALVAACAALVLGGPSGGTTLYRVVGGESSGEGNGIGAALVALAVFAVAVRLRRRFVRK
jgi:phage shock protein A